MASTEEFGRQLTARYAFRGAAAALDRTVPLVACEQILLHGVARLQRTRLLPRPVILRLTSLHLATLTHYAFGPDRVLVLTRAAVRDIALESGTVAVTWRDSTTTSTFSLGPWVGRNAFDRPLRDMTYLTQQLTDWLAD